MVDSRYYRANLLWENGSLRFRDIHMFNEKFPSVYETQKATSNECSFFTLPIVDGYMWSSSDTIAGLRFKAIKDGKEILLEGGDPTINDLTPGKLHVSWPLKSFKATVEMELDERQIKITMNGDKSIEWYIDLSTGSNKKLPFEKITANKIEAQFEGMNYILTAGQGSFSKPMNRAVLKISPTMNSLALKF